MQFANPNYLWALSAILIPIIVHIFQFRKLKNTYFTNVDLLKELNVERRKVSRLKQLIILCLRILAIIALVFVFACPYIPKDNGINTSGSNLINIYIDNSPSMEGKNGSLTLSDDAKNRAKQIIYFYDDNTLYRIFSNNSPINPPLLNKDDAITAVNQIATSFSKRNSKSIISSFNTNTDEATDFTVTNYYLSDFQKYNIDTNGFKQLNHKTLLIPLANDMSDNLNISDASFETHVNLINELHKININIVNESAVDYDKVPVNLLLSGKLISSSSFNFPGKSSQTISLFFPDNEPGFKHGYVEVDDRPITFDNKFFFTYRINDNIKILDINSGQPNKYIKALFGNDSLFQFRTTNYKSIRYDELGNYDLIILDNIESISSGISNEIVNFINSGKNCLILTPENIDLQSYNDFLPMINCGKISEMIPTEDKNVSFAFTSSFFDGVFSDTPDPAKDNIELPTIKSYYPIMPVSTPLIRLTDSRSSILSRSSAGSGNAFILTTILDSDYSDLQFNALFVPIMYRIVLYGQTANNLNYTSSQKMIPLSVPNTNLENLSLSCSEDSTYSDYSFEYINGKTYAILGSFNEPVAGNYSVISNSKVVDGFSVNNDREESELDFYNKDDIEKLIDGAEDVSIIQADNKDFEKTLASTLNNKELWKTFLIIALCLLICEMVLLRLFKI